MRRRWPKPDIPYLLLLGGSFVVALLAGFLGGQVDNGAYDWMFRSYRPAPWRTQSILLTIDEETLAVIGGLRNIRPLPLATALESIAAAGPRAVAIDLIPGRPRGPGHGRPPGSGFPRHSQPGAAVRTDRRGEEVGRTRCRVSPPWPRVSATCTPSRTAWMR